MPADGTPSRSGLDPAAPRSHHHSTKGLSDGTDAAGRSRPRSRPSVTRCGARSSTGSPTGRPRSTSWPRCSRFRSRRFEAHQGARGRSGRARRGRARPAPSASRRQRSRDPSIGSRRTDDASRPATRGSTSCSRNEGADMTNQRTVIAEPGTQSIASRASSRRRPPGVEAHVDADLVAQWTGPPGPSSRCASSTLGPVALELRHLGARPGVGFPRVVPRGDRARGASCRPGSTRKSRDIRPWRSSPSSTCPGGRSRSRD